MYTTLVNVHFLKMTSMYNLYGYNIRSDLQIVKKIGRKE